MLAGLLDAVLPVSLSSRPIMMIVFRNLYAMVELIRSPIRHPFTAHRGWSLLRFQVPATNVQSRRSPQPRYIVSFFPSLAPIAKLARKDLSGAFVPAWPEATGSEASLMPNTLFPPHPGQTWQQSAPLASPLGEAQSENPGSNFSGRVAVGGSGGAKLQQACAKVCLSTCRCVLPFFFFVSCWRALGVQLTGLIDGVKGLLDERSVLG